MHLAHFDNEYEASGKKEIEKWAKEVDDPERYKAWQKKYTTTTIPGEKARKKTIRLKS